jgi:5'-nucleotidase
VELDPDMANTLLDQRDSGKMLLLITNSDYVYTDTMMSYAYDRFLPGDMTWRDLFDMVIVMARKVGAALGAGAGGRRASPALVGGPGAACQ